jgi:biotin carboxylase
VPTTISPSAVVELYVSPRLNSSEIDGTKEDRPPLLAIQHAGLSLPVMTSAQAAAGLCSILWLVDGEDPSVQADRRALERFGQVADLGGQSPERWADVIGPLRPDGALTFSDNRMVELARLAEDLGLPFHRPDVARRLTDKLSQRDALRRAGLPTPDTAAVGSALGVDALKKLAADVRYPAVLKPVHGTDSRTTVRVDDAEDLLLAFRRLFKGSRPDMMIEEYLADRGPCLGQDFANYLSVESVVSAGRAEHFAVTGRFPLAPPLRESGFFIPADLSPDQKSAVTDLTSTALDALGVETGCLHTEIKFTPDGPRVIEVNGRLGGGVPLMLEMTGAASAPRLAMEVALGRTPDVASLVPQQGIGFRLLFHAPITARRVLAVEGLTKIGQLPGAPTATLHRPPGAEIDWRTGTNDYIYSVIGVAQDNEQLRAIRRMAETSVDMRFEHVRTEDQAVEPTAGLPE